mmetsp:Transcript_11597/g.19772  ORF Transcript_11597/g.19772 Transcript_11597/m.19772 type:complete len:205 (-) Transcript_11597:475-1089(-)
MRSATHALQSSWACSSAVNLPVLLKPSRLYALVFISRSSSLNFSILSSTDRLASNNGSLLRISALAAHVFTCSRNLCNFLISFFKSCSYFSFWFCCEAECTLSQISSKSSFPSTIFFSTRSTSAKSFLLLLIVILQLLQTLFQQLQLNALPRCHRKKVGQNIFKLRSRRQRNYKCVISAQDPHLFGNSQSDFRIRSPDWNLIQR